MKRIFLLSLPVVIAVFSLSPSLQAEPSLVLGSEENYSLAGKTELLRDESRALTIQEVLQPENAKRFYQSPEKDINLGSTSDAVWLRFTLKNEAKTPWYLFLDYPHMDHIELYSIEKGERHEKRQYGDMLPFHKRDILHHNYFFPISIKQGETKTWYMRFQTGGTMLIPLSVYSNKYMGFTIDRSQFFFGLLYGILGIVTLANFLFFTATRNINYFYYVVYLVLSIIAQIFMDGMAIQYLWPNNPELAPIGISFVFLMVASICQFSRNFLNLRGVAPIIDKIIFGFFILALVLSASPVILGYSLSMKLSIFMAMALSFLVIIASVISLVRGNISAWYFIFAWSLLLSGIFFRALLYNGTFPKNFFTSNAMAIGSIFEVILLSLALIDHINQMRKDKEVAQRELIVNQKKALEEQTQMNAAFARFVPQQFLHYLNKDNVTEVALGDSVAKKMTVLFCDIRSFTDLSEKMQPDENFKFLNSFYKRIGPIIRTHGGFIDKYIGDAIMALFPNQPEDAIDAAINMQKMVRRFNMLRKRRGYEPIYIGIGIHAGNLMLGTIGEKERMESTVISDAVNLASRIERLTKNYGASILVSEHTIAQIDNPEQYRYRRIDRVKVKGKQNFVTVIEIFDGDMQELSQKKTKTLPHFEQGIDYFLNGNFENAKLILDQLMNENPEDETVRSILRQIDTKLRAS